MIYRFFALIMTSNWSLCKMQSFDFHKQSLFCPLSIISIRYLLFIKDKEQIYLVDSDNSVFSAPRISFPSRKRLGEHVRNTLADSVGQIKLVVI